MINRRYGHPTCRVDPVTRRWATSDDGHLPPAETLVSPDRWTVVVTWCVLQEPLGDGSAWSYDGSWTERENPVHTAVVVAGAGWVCPCGRPENG